MHRVPLDCDDAQFKTTFRLQPGSLYEVRLTLGDRSIIGKRRVVSRSISDVDQKVVTFCSGIQFIEPSGGVCRVVLGFIDAMKDGRLVV